MASGLEERAGHIEPARRSTRPLNLRPVPVKCCLPTCGKYSAAPADPAHLPTGKPDVAQISLEPAILPALVTMEDRPWSEWSRGKPLSPRGLATPSR